MRVTTPTMATYLITLSNIALEFLPHLLTQVTSAWKEASFTDGLWQALRQKPKIDHDIYAPNSFKIIDINLII
jgi:hypothetical protein